MQTQCPICSSVQTKTITNKVRFGNTAEVMRCEHCSLVFLNQASFEFPKEFYEQEYHQTYLTHVEPDALDPEKYYQKMLKTTKPWSDRINQLMTGNEIVLDVGCSTGHLLTSIRDKAHKVYGHELSEKEIEYCRTTLGLDVGGVPLDQRFQPETFDYITMIFVLEHIADPIEFLTFLKRFLKPEGKFIILVPNVKDALLNFYDIPTFSQFYFCIEHLFYYEPKTIKDVFTKAGLRGKIETVQEYPITNHLNWGYRQKPSDVLASRRSVPDIPLRNEEMAGAWEDMWVEVNRLYRTFLSKFGFGDRIWCEVGKSHD